MVNRYFAVLSHAFTVALNEWQWCMDNLVRKLRKTREAQGRTRYLSDEELKALLEACQNSRNPYLYTIVVLAITTGARRGELLQKLHSRSEPLQCWQRHTRAPEDETALELTPGAMLSKAFTFHNKICHQT